MSNRFRSLILISMSMAATSQLQGCSRSAAPIVPAKDADNLMNVSAAYSECLTKKGKAPANESDLRPFLQTLGDADAMLRSPEDGQPYVILWGVDYRNVPIKRMPPPIIAYQKDGKGGRRYVLTRMGVQTLTDDEFQKADFIAAKPK